MGRHLVIAVLLVGLAFASGVHYDAWDDRHWAYPTDEALYGDYEQHVGEQALLFGTVQSIDRDENEAIVAVDSDDGEFEVLVKGIDADVEPGGVVQVYGPLETGRTVTASEVVVVERSPTERHSKYGISALGVALALGMFFRYWRIDRGRLTFEPRKESKSEPRKESRANAEQGD